MGLRTVRYDMNHGAARRILQPNLEAWARSHPPDAEVLEVGAGHAMPMQDDRFDAALAISVLEHVDDPYQVVREMYRVLKPGAPVFAWIPFTFGVHGFPEDVSRFTTFGMRRLFERAGFEIVRIDEKPYAGAFLQMTNLVHFVLPRTDHRRWVRPLNKALFLLFRMGYPLDQRFSKLKLKNLYTGAEVEARKPLA